MSTPRVDPHKIAVALSYEIGAHEAPVVAAKGKGYIAEQIIAIAREHGVEIRENRDLAQMLSALEIDAPIPLEAYQAVAEILSYIYRANEKQKERRA